MASEEAVGLEELLKQAHGLPPDKQRKVASILGSVVADAAAQPLHWVYNPDALKSAVAGIDCPEFLPKSANPFYCIPTGSQSPYGDQLINMLESLVASKGFNADDFGEKVFKAFGPGSPYDNPVTADYAKGKQDKRYPIQSKWVTFMLSRFTKFYSEKKKLEDETEEDTNDDPDSIARCVPLVALYTGNPEMLSTAYDACSMIQSSDIILTIVLAACRVMEQYILQDGTEADGSPQVEKVIGDLKSAKRTFPNDLDLAVSGFLADALATKEMTVDEATAKLGKA